MAPTFERGDSFVKDWSALSQSDKERFRAAVAQLVEDLNAKRLPRRRLRVQRVQGTQSVWETTWAPDGRATFTYGAEVTAGEPHVQWRRIGTHDISARPYDDCCSFLAPRRPATWADPARVAAEEGKLDLDALTALALASHTVEKFRHPLQDADAPGPAIHA